MERFFGMSVLWEVRRGSEKWEPKMHIDKEVRTSKTFFNNLPFTPKSGFAFIATSNKLKFLFSFDSFKSWKLRAMWSKMTQSTTMVTNIVFRSTRLFREGSSNMVLFSLQHGTFWSYVTNHTIMMASRNKLRSTQILRMRLKQRLRLKSLSLYFLVSFVWRNVHRFVSKGRTHNRHKNNTTWLQQRFSSFLATGSEIKHLACILRDSFSHLRSSTS